MPSNYRGKIFEHWFWYEIYAIKNGPQSIRVRNGITEGHYGPFFHDIEYFSQKSMVFIVDPR